MKISDEVEALTARMGQAVRRTEELIARNGLFHDGAHDWQIGQAWIWIVGAYSGLEQGLKLLGTVGKGANPRGEVKKWKQWGHDLEAAYIEVREEDRKELNWWWQGWRSLYREEKSGNLKDLIRRANRGGKGGIDWRYALLAQESEKPLPVPIIEMVAIWRAATGIIETRTDHWNRERTGRNERERWLARIAQEAVNAVEDEHQNMYEEAHSRDAETELHEESARLEEAVEKGVVNKIIDEIRVPGTSGSNALRQIAESINRHGRNGKERPNWSLDWQTISQYTMGKGPYGGQTLYLDESKHEFVQPEWPGNQEWSKTEPASGVRLVRGPIGALVEQCQRRTNEHWKIEDAGPPWKWKGKMAWYRRLVVREITEGREESRYSLWQNKTKQGLVVEEKAPQERTWRHDAMLERWPKLTIREKT